MPHLGPRLDFVRRKVQLRLLSQPKNPPTSVRIEPVISGPMANSEGEKGCACHSRLEDSTIFSGPAVMLDGGQWDVRTSPLPPPQPSLLRP